MMLTIVIFFLLVSVFLYCLLGGADFGAGILELFSGEKKRDITRKLVTKAMSPIWEANHMWLIIVVVILFNAFPPIYTRIATSLSIPLILLLVGIVLRGTAFTFRQYDAVKDNSQEVYSRIFSWSSLMVTFFFGVTTGALVSGNITVAPVSFMEGYVYSWLNLFSMSVGVFLCSLFAFIASVYLIGDSTETEVRKYFIRKSKITNIAAIASGGLVFISSIIDKNEFASQFFSHPESIALIFLSTISLPLLWKMLEMGKVWYSRILAGAQLLFILSAFYFIYFPVIVNIKYGADFTLYNSAAPEVTQRYLAYALLGGSLIIFPSLYYLLRIFKLRQE